VQAEQHTAQFQRPWSKWQACDDMAEGEKWTRRPWKWLLWRLLQGWTVIFFTTVRLFRNLRMVIGSPLSRGKERRLSSTSRLGLGG